MLFALVLTACGESSSSSGTTAPASTAGPDEMTVTAFFVGGGKVAATDVRVPRTKGVATAALQALINGPPAGLGTELPQGIDEFYVSV